MLKDEYMLGGNESVRGDGNCFDIYTGSELNPTPANITIPTRRYYYVAIPMSPIFRPCFVSLPDTDSFAASLNLVMHFIQTSVYIEIFSEAIPAAIDLLFSVMDP